MRYSCLNALRLPRTYQYIHHVLDSRGCGLAVNMNLMTLPVQSGGNLGNSAIFQRLGMKFRGQSSGDQASVPC